MKKLLVSLFIFLLAGTASAQNVTGNSKLAFDLPGQTVAIASAATYNGYVDNSLNSVVLSGLTCSGTTTVTCTVNLPALTLGNHTITISQVFGTIESAKSLPLGFTFVVVVTPTNLRISGS